MYAPLQNTALEVNSYNQWCLLQGMQSDRFVSRTEQSPRFARVWDPSVDGHQLDRIRMKSVVSVKRPRYLSHQAHLDLPSLGKTAGGYCTSLRAFKVFRDLETRKHGSGSELNKLRHNKYGTGEPVHPIYLMSQSYMPRCVHYVPTRVLPGMSCCAY